MIQAHLQKSRDSKRTHAATPNLPQGLVKPEVLQRREW